MNKGPTTKRRARAIDRGMNYRIMLAKMGNIILGAAQKEYSQVHLKMTTLDKEAPLFFFSNSNKLYAKLWLMPHGYAALKFAKSGTDLLFDDSPFHYLSLEDPAVFRHFKWLINNTY